LVDLTGDYPETVVTATNPDGCLTVVMTTDGSVSCESSTFYEEISWCAGCGQDACGFTWYWEPADNLLNPNSSQPTVIEFDGTPTEYVAFVEPIGLENCATTDTVLVVPGFEFETSFSDPTCLITDGVITITISEPAAEGPWKCPTRSVVPTRLSLIWPIPNLRASRSRKIWSSALTVWRR
jgi:hypothetical protein